MKLSQLKNSLLIILIIGGFGIHTSCAQTDTAGMTKEEKVAEKEYQESVETDANRRVEIPYEVLPESIRKDLHDRYDNPVLIKAWREVDEEGVVMGYTVNIGDKEENNKEYFITYDREGKPEKRERLEAIKDKSVSPDTD